MSERIEAPEQSVVRVAPVVWLVAAATLLLHLATANGYGIFRDEMYYIVCSQRLDWGYVDHPPLSILLLAFWRLVFGESLLALRFLPGLAHACAALLFGLIARELGARRFGQSFAALACAVMPVYLATSSYYSMNPLDTVFWAVLTYLLCRIAATENPALWLLFGAVAGLGLQNKFSVAFLGAALTAGVILTQQRKWLLNPYLYAGGAIAVLVLLPHLVWMYRHDWITLEFMHNASTYKNSPTNPVKYFFDQVLMAHPLLLPLWMAGIGYGLSGRVRQPARMFAIMFVVLFLFFSLTRGKSYYLAPAYALVVPAGALAIERFSDTRRAWLRPVALVWTLAGGLALAPLAIPMLPVEQVLRYQSALGIGRVKDEVGHSAALNQHFSDRFGWREYVEVVAKAYQALPEAERAQCAILCDNYGEAAAIDVLGRDLGLPYAISMHNNYWLWGPRNASPDVLMVVSWVGRDIANAGVFASGGEVARAVHPYSEEQEIPIYVFRNLKPPLTIDALWRQHKKII